MPPTMKQPRTGPRRAAVTLAGSQEFCNWLDDLCRHCRLTRTTIAELAIIEFARSKGFTPEPPER